MSTASNCNLISSAFGEIISSYRYNNQLVHRETQWPSLLSYHHPPHNITLLNKRSSVWKKRADKFLWKKPPRMLGSSDQLTKFRSEMHSLFFHLTCALADVNLKRSFSSTPDSLLLSTSKFLAYNWGAVNSLPHSISKVKLILKHTLHEPSENNCLPILLAELCEQLTKDGQRPPSTTKAHSPIARWHISLRNTCHISIKPGCKQNCSTTWINAQFKNVKIHMHHKRRRNNATFMK